MTVGSSPFTLVHIVHYTVVHLFDQALNLPVYFACVQRNSVVDVATPYGLNGLGIESRWGRDLPQRSRPALGPTQPTVQGVPGLFPGLRPMRGVDYPPQLGLRLKKE
jgi:hypothetical protein